MNYIIGLDIGIGSVGWSVIRNEENCKRIEDYGVRIFDSSENVKEQKSYAQQRREKRGERRLKRRRSYRKNKLKYYLESIGFVKQEELDEFFAQNSHNIIDLRVDALDKKISPVELTACLLHIANHRGYKPFYEIDEDSKKSEDGENAEIMSNTVSIINNGNYRSIAEAIKSDPAFQEENTGRYNYRNNKTSKDILFPNALYEKEVKDILNKQASFYDVLTPENIDYIFNIIFSRRDFEDGPGDPNDEYRKYKGFIDSIGKCQFYKDQVRGSRYSIIGDLFSMINKLSQYKYIDDSTGEVVSLSPKCADEIINYLIMNGNLGKNDLKKILLNNNIKILELKGEKEKETLPNCIKYIKTIKKIFEEYGFVWSDIIAGDYLSDNHILNRIGDILSKNITPNRRKRVLKQEISIISDNDKIIEKLAKQNLSGVTKASNKYMVEAINAFLNGIKYGDFQADFNLKADEKEKLIKLPPFDINEEFINNPVVFRSINETRKVVNAIIEQYGSPCAINIEVAKDLNVSFKNRRSIEKQQKKNRDKKEDAKLKVAELLGIDVEEVKYNYVERYILGEMQSWKCLYSGKVIADKAEAIKNENKIYEVDHIVPFSLILDDSLNNKALVYAKENQIKGQRTPLMYISDTKRFLSDVNYLATNGKISKTKLTYLTLKDLYSEEAQKLLNNWKSRNLNDTRYICKYLVRYFNENLLFAKNNNESDKPRPNVYAVKGAITSMLRRQWLNKNTWGTPEKSELKKITYFDHAVDAIVVGNCLPAYVIIAVENRKLKDIYYSNGKRKTKEYFDSLDSTVETLMRYYGVSPKESRKLLETVDSTPSLIEKLRLEVECRVKDYELMRYFVKDYEKKTDIELYEIYRLGLITHYYDDLDFANSIEMPIVSFKQDRKYNRQITTDTIEKKNKQSEKTSLKVISENNSSVLIDNCYYCVEIYSDKDGNTQTHAIKINSIFKKNGKLYFKDNYKYPDGYNKHIMYLFKGDYIRIMNHNKLIEGYYFSVKSINRSNFYISKYNTRYLNKSGKKEGVVIGIGKKDVVEKVNISILGKRGGIIKNCGEPLSYLREKE